ncbi:MAG: trimethylamine methyltransferase family protein [Anaerolineales bacterium]|nr:trimethylamine methyltransferase family protein [Anaerolineales bacterium]
MMKTSSTTQITPRLQILTEDQKETLFLSALEVLEGTGVRVDNDEGMELLSGAGARVSPQRCVHIPSYLVEDALASAPRSIAIYSRDGEPAACVCGKTPGWEPCFAMRCRIWTWFRSPRSIATFPATSQFVLATRRQSRTAPSL